MKTFSCACGNTLHFENSQCMVCGRPLGFISERLWLSALEPEADGLWRACLDGQRYRQCANYHDYQICNWLVPEQEAQRYCASCRLNHIIPNLSEKGNLRLWHRIEMAKRRLLYTLRELHLPIIGRDEDPVRGLAFEFMADEPDYDEFSDQINEAGQVLTGHRSGMITINLREAEDSAREKMREMMNEGYRTLLGHFRHECGHYYWDRLVRDSDWLAGFRERFGDERLDYQQALNKYYQQGARGDWQNGWISAYASSHPWEDWAETWAHYLHMVDTLETARDFGLRIPAWHGMAESSAEMQLDDAMDFDALLRDWDRLSVGLNALNRSMGLPDAYPFILSDMALHKLRFVDELIRSVN
jgi:hypothetical protein